MRLRGGKRTTGGLLACALALVGAAPATAVEQPPLADGNGLHVVATKRVGPRLFEVTLTTPLLTAPTNVDVLLPTDYDAHPKRRYPVLWLFHGTSGWASDWTKKGDAEATTRDRPMIVVMPDAGIDGDGGSWFTDWVNGGAYGPPKWETHHVNHLIPWVDSQLRTIDARSGRAIAGLSQGGFGAMSYAARYPDTFAAAASFSGAVDIAANPERADPLVTPIINLTEVALIGVPPNTIFGDRATNEINWAAHDPVTLAGNLRGMGLFTWTGNGEQGPLDPEPNPGASAIEAGVHELTVLFNGELAERSIPVEADDYGPGTHTWPYWARDLRELMGPLSDIFDRPDATPWKVDYMSADPHYAQWGWRVDVDRPAREFSTLQGAGDRGYTLTGSGSATVTTPGVYRPGAQARVTVSSPAGSRTDTATVGRDGALRIATPLGPGNPAQQFTAGANTAVYSTRVGIDARVRPCASARTVLVRLPASRGLRIASATASADGRPTAASRTGRAVRVGLAGLAPGTHRIAVRVTGRRGGRAVRRSASRRVFTCRPAGS